MNDENFTAPTSSPEYESKFAGFIRSCEEAKSTGADCVLINHPLVLGDNYEEMIESLSRLASANVALRIAHGDDADSK